MHKVMNYGSALQAYALQQKLLSLGYENELIDYKFPYHEKNGFSLNRFIKNVIFFLCNAVAGFPKEKRTKKFMKFYEENYRESRKSYTLDNIAKTPPLYDAYITGSDQVWNPRFAGNDPNFMLAFAPDEKPKFSYASSFATTEIDEKKHSFYSHYLSRYNRLSVRETTGVDIIKKLVKKDVSVNVDPTLLLSQNVWDSLSLQSSLILNYKYVLVYVLDYMIGGVFDEVQKITDYVSKMLGVRVVYLMGRKEDIFRPNSILYKSGGPAEFVYLFKNSEFVITTSFHGVAFSVIYDKPFMGIVNEENKNDSRIQSLLMTLGAYNSIWDYKKKPSCSKEELLALKANQDMVNEERNKSEIYLKEILTSI